MTKRLDSPKTPRRGGFMENRQVVSRDSNRVVRAAACAAFEIFTNCRKYNQGHLDNYLTCVSHVLYGIIRAGAPGEVPVPKNIHRSTVSDAEKRFFDLASVHLKRIERQATSGRRPVQPKIVTQAMSMLPSSRSGEGPQRAKQLLANLPPGLLPIHKLLSEGLQLLTLRESYLNWKLRAKRSPKP